MSEPKTYKIYGDEEIARRRDDVIRRMANMPPQPHKPLGESISKPKTGALQKKRGRSSKSTDAQNA
jgi:hypothetical protein